MAVSSIFARRGAVVTRISRTKRQPASTCKADDGQPCVEHVRARFMGAAMNAEDVVTAKTPRDIIACNAVKRDRLRTREIAFRSCAHDGYTVEGISLMEPRADRSSCQRKGLVRRPMKMDDRRKTGDTIFGLRKWVPEDA